MIDEAVRVLEERLVDTASGRERRDRLLNVLQETEENELGIQSLNREEMLKDHRYYDGIQWDWKDAQLLQQRGQAPVSYNWLKPRVDWLSGTERRSRSQFKVLPRAEGKDRMEDAELKTDVLKYAFDVNHANHHRSAAFKQMLIGGQSWIELGIRDDPEDEALYVRQEHWWNVLEDSCATELDDGDMRYLYRRRHIDLDIGLAYFPGHEPGITAAAYNSNQMASRFDQYYLGLPLEEYDVSATLVAGRSHVQFNAGAWVNSTRPRVLFREAYYFDPVAQKVVSRGGSIFDRVKLRCRRAIFVDNYLIEDDFSPYRHNKIPFVRYACYRRAIDGAPYGVIRQQRDPSDSFNKRMSKALFAISAVRVETESGAIDPKLMTAEQMREEVAKPNAHLRWARGALSGSMVRITDGREVADAHIELANIDKAFIDESMNVNRDNLGLKSNAQSGIAIARRQNEGAVANAELFDNAFLSRQREGEQANSLIEQYYQDEKSFRLTGERGGMRWRSINRYDPETGRFENDVTRFRSDFVLDEQGWQSTVAQSAMEELWALLQEIGKVDPQLVRAMLDLVVQYSPLPGKDLMVQRIRKMTGMTDPEQPETEEEAAARARREQLEATQQSLAMQEAMLKLNALARQNDLIEAKAVRETIQAFFAAIQGARANAFSPSLAPVADSMLADAGFRDRGGQDPNIPAGIGTPGPGAAAPQPAPSAGTGANAGIETVRHEEPQGF